MLSADRRTASAVVSGITLPGWVDITGAFAVAACRTSAARPRTIRARVSVERASRTRSWDDAALLTVVASGTQATDMRQIAGRVVEQVARRGGVAGRDAIEAFLARASGRRQRVTIAVAPAVTRSALVHTGQTRGVTIRAGHTRQWIAYPGYAIITSGAHRGNDGGLRAVATGGTNRTVSHRCAAVFRQVGAQRARYLLGGGRAHGTVVACNDLTVCFGKCINL